MVRDSSSFVSPVIGSVKENIKQPELMGIGS
jgi:hypothetical protein